jgi:hypothetical protein
MKQQRLAAMLVLFRAAALGLLLLVSQASAAEGAKCLPSCATNDGRFLVVTDDPAASLLDVLSDNTLEVEIEVPACIVGETFTVGVFDGDTGGLRGQHWDFNFGIGTATNFVLYADPNNNGTGTWEVLSFGELDVLDNAWVDFVVANVPEAYDPVSGNCFYRLRAELLGPIIPPPPLPAPAVTNSLKFRASANVSIELFQLPFSFIAAAIGDTKIIDGVLVGSALPDLKILYPVCAEVADVMECFNLICPGGPGPACDASVKDPANTTYDGSFSFLLDVDVTSTKLTVWDGDFDRGKWDGTESDTDDENSPFDPTQSLSCFLPPGDPDQPEDCFFPNLTNVRDEGVALGTGPSTGAPPDDTFGGSQNALFLRTPSIRYDLLRVEGDGSRTLVASNENPSGNREWEKYRIQTLTAPPDPDDLAPPVGEPDEVVPDIPAGIYEVRIDGMDLQNLNALSLPIVGEHSINNPPVASDDAFGTLEDTPLEVPAPGVLANDVDVDGDTLFVDNHTLPAHGLLSQNPDGSFTYTPNPDYCGSDGYSYTVSDGNGGEDSASVNLDVECVNDPPIFTEITQPAERWQYSDLIEPLRIVAEDADSPELEIGSLNLPEGLAIEPEADCSPSGADGVLCAWVVGGPMLAPSGIVSPTQTITVTFTVSDTGAVSTSAVVSPTVVPEDVLVAFDANNPVAVPVDGALGVSGSYTVTHVVGELDEALGMPGDRYLAGDISKAAATLMLEPMGPGPSIQGACGPPQILDGVADPDSDYDYDLSRVSCRFAEVPVNTYTVMVRVGGGYYAGSAEDVLTV